MSTRTESIRAFANERRRAAFTLVELLVVMAIILVVVTVTLPAVGRIIKSNNFASAINAVTATLGNARALAMGNDRHTAVAFLYDVETEQYSLMVLEEAPGGTEGKLTTCATRRPEGAAAAAYRPAAGTTPVELPEGTAVFGLSFAIPTSLTDAERPSDPVYALDTCFDVATEQWYAQEVFESPGDSDLRVTPWLFPRNDPRIYIDPRLQNGDPRPIPSERIPLEDLWLAIAGQAPDAISSLDEDDLIAAVRHAMTFAVVFNPEGSVTTVFDRGERLLDAYIEHPTLPRDPDPQGDDPMVYDDDRLFDPELVNPLDDARTTPNPEVRLRAAVQLAVVDLSDLASGAGVETPWTLHPAESLSTGGPLSSDVWPPYRDDGGEVVANADRLNEKVEAVSDWIDGNAQILSFNRYTGRVVKQ